MLFDNTQVKPPKEREVDLAVRYAARGIVAQMSLVFAFWPGLFAWFVVPAFGLRFTSRPELAALIGQCKPLFVLVSVVSVFAWWVLVRQRRGTALLALWIFDTALVALQLWAVSPDGMWH